MANGSCGVTTSHKMTWTPSVLLTTLIVFTVKHVQAGVGITDVGLYYEVHHNTSMVSNAVVMELETRTEFECVSECRFHCSCMSVNVMNNNTTRLLCTMFNVTSGDQDAALTEKHGSSYIELDLEKEGDEDCGTKMKGGSASSSGVYVLGRRNCETMMTSCDTETGTGGWTMVQRRMDGSVDFYRGWQEYKNGFGCPSGEFWLGLDRIHYLTKSGEYTLRFDLWDDAEHRFAEYKNATVANENDSYRLDYASYTGTAGDAMTYYSRGRAFATYDKDNGAEYRFTYPQNCAQLFKGAWWYGDCHRANLNGLYLNGSTTQFATGMVWKPFRGHYYSLLRTEIKVKRM